MSNYAALAVKKQELVRKVLQGSVFQAPPTATGITSATLFQAATTRTVTDGATTINSPNLSSATAAFTSADIGAAVTGTGIGVGATILSITSPSVAVLSVNSTATGSAVSVTIAQVAGLKALPTGWSDLGWTTAAGAVFNRAVSETDISSWGNSSPTRSDITSDTTTLQVVCQETKLQTIALYTGVTASTVIPKAATGGSVEIQKPLLPVPQYSRILTVGVDSTNQGEIYLCRYLPNARVTNFGSQNYTNGADALEYDVTLTGYLDSVAGFTESYLFGGPGWQYLLTDMGFPAAA